MAEVIRETSTPAVAEVAGRPTGSVDPAELLFRSVFTIALIGVCVPIKNVHYLLPWILVVHLALSGMPKTLWRLVGTTIGLGVASVVAAMLSMGTVNVPGVLWVGLTYSPLAFLLVLDRRLVTSFSPETVRSVCDQLSLIVILQAGLGVVQLLVSGNPDAVAGTFDPTGFLTGVTIGQVYLGAFVVIAGFFLMGVGTTPLHRIAVLAAAVCVIISQSGHQTLLAVAALIAATILVRPTSRRILAATAFALIAAIMIRALSPVTLSRAEGWFDKTVVSDDSLKREVWSDSLGVIRDLPHTLLGYGGGQFSSRGGLIASGDYLAVQIPAPLTGRSPIFISDVDPAIARFDVVGEGSAIAKPYSSVTSVLAELGPIAFGIAVVAVVVVIVGQLRRGFRGNEDERRVRTYVAAGLVFFCGLSLVENYLEFPQAMFVGGLLYYVADRTATAAGNGGAQPPV